MLILEVGAVDVLIVHTSAASLAASTVALLT